MFIYVYILKIEDVLIFFIIFQFYFLIYNLYVFDKNEGIIRKLKKII